MYFHKMLGTWGNTIEEIPITQSILITWWMSARTQMKRKPCRSIISFPMDTFAKLVVKICLKGRFKDQDQLGCASTWLKYVCD